MVRVPPSFCFAHTHMLVAVSRLREAHRIVGSLVGTLQAQPQQNVALALPMQLLPEQARLAIVDLSAQTSSFFVF